MHSPDRFSVHARAVAEQILGEPNKHLSSQHELRFGQHGSISVDLRTGQFFDHQEKAGGGVLWFVARETGKTVEGGNAIKWLTEHGFDVEVDRPMPDRPSGASGSAPPHGDRPARRTDAEGNWIPDHVPEGARLTATYDYLDHNGRLSYQVCRYDWTDEQSEKGRGKTFLQRRPDERNPDRWRYKTKGMTPLPYRLPELIEDVRDGSIIFICEGEKKVDMLRDLGVPATCNHGGAGKFPLDLAPWFRGAEIVVIPDNDQPGRDHADLIGAQLAAVASSVSILDLPGVPPKGSVDDWIPAGGTIEQLYDLRATAARPWRAKPPESRFNALTWRDIFAPGVKLDPLIKGLLTQNEISLLVGASQSGKSFLAIDLAMSVARGQRFFGRKVTRGGVIYQAGESAAGVCLKRIPAYAEHHACDDEDLPFVLLQSQVDLFGSDEHAEALVKESIAWGATFDYPLRLIVIDTFNRATPGANENDGRDMSLIIERCEMIRRETGAHVMLVHHMNAGGTKARGHTSLFAAVDSTINVQKVEDGLRDGNGRQLREWSISKMKEGEDGVTERFVLPQVILGHDEDGDEITSCVVVKPQGDAPGEEKAAEGMRVSGVTAIVLRAIYDVIRDKGLPADMALNLPRDTRVVPKSEVSARLKAVMASPDSDIGTRKGETIEDARKRHHEANRKAAARARDHLFSKGIIGMSDDQVWLTGKNVVGFPKPPGAAAFNRRRADIEDDDDPVVELPFDASPEDFA